MATSTKPTPSPEEANKMIAELYSALGLLAPHLPEPIQGSSKYAVMTAKLPEIDAVFCRHLGKVVHIVAIMKNASEHPITLRGQVGAGENSPISWNQDYQADSIEMKVPNLRTFTFRVPQEQMDQTLEFKLCQTDPNKKMQWSEGKNWTIDLKTRGLIVLMDVKDVTFA